MCEFEESDVGRRLDGDATQCTVHFKVGRAMRAESFELISRAGLREVLRTVIEQLSTTGEAASAAPDEPGEDDGRPTSLELLKPFKMAHASPRVFWNLAREFGDVEGGLRALLPEQDWSFLQAREKRRSDKAVANAAQAAEAEAQKAERAAKRRSRAVASASDGPESAQHASELAGGTAAQPLDVSIDQDVGEANAEIRGEIEEEEAHASDDDEIAEEPAADDANGWEAAGKKAMLQDAEYDYACICLNRALLLRIEQLGGREAADGAVEMATPWYLHGSALLRRAQALALTSASEVGEPSAPMAAGTPPSPAVVAAARERLGEGWRADGCGAIGRRVRRFFAKHGAFDGTVVAWQEGGLGGADGSEGEEGIAEDEAREEALYHILMDDGDEEDVDEEELDDALEAHRDGRQVDGEVEGLLEAAWESLEMAASIYERPPARTLGAAEAHERLGDCALQNGQPERALEEYTQARDLLLGLKETGELNPDDRRIADIEWYLGVTQLQLGRAEAAVEHYTRAAGVLRLRRANLQRVALDRQIATFSRQADTGDGGGEDGAAESEAAEIQQLSEIVDEIEARLRQVQEAAREP